MDGKIAKKGVTTIFDRCQIRFVDLNSAINCYCSNQSDTISFSPNYFNNSRERITSLGLIRKIFNLSSISLPK